MVHPFAEGGSTLTTVSTEAEHIGSLYISNPNQTYITTVRDMDGLLERSLSRRDIEISLGLKEGQLSRGNIVRYDIQNPLDRNLRMPDPSTGNVYHRPNTGRTIGDMNESVIDTPMKNDSLVNRTELS